MIKISKELFENVMGFNCIYIEIVGRKNQKMIKYANNYINSKTISLNEFVKLKEKKEQNESI